MSAGPRESEGAGAPESKAGTRKPGVFGPVAVRGPLTLWRRGAEDAPERREVDSKPRSALARAQEKEGKALLVSLSRARELGLLVLGRPGTGKSTLLLHLILEDLRRGTPCCVLDPHGDLVAAVLKRSPKKARKRILVFDPADTLRPVGLDLLDARTDAERDHCVQFMLALFEELFRADQQGPILHQAISNALRLGMETGSSLAEVPALLGDKTLLRARLARCANPWVRHYFTHVWLEIKGSDRAEHLAYFTSKLARFLDDSVLRGIFGQKEAPELEAHLEAGGAVLASLSRGTLGELNARILGMVLLHKLERLTLRRDALAPPERRPLHLYVDECHDVVTANLPRFLGAARKFGVGITLADQQLESLPGLLAETAIGSVGHAALFRQGGGFELSRLAGLLWPRYGELELQSLPNFEALVRVTGEGGGHQIGRLRVPKPRRGSPAEERRIRNLSRRRFGRPGREVERAILERLGWVQEEEEPDTADAATAEEESEAPSEEVADALPDAQGVSLEEDPRTPGIDWLTVRVPVPRPAAPVPADPTDHQDDTTS